MTGVGSTSSIEDRFAAALTAQEPDGDGGAQDLPVRLARTAAAVLGTAAAGISLLTDEPLRRLPVGASDAQAALAEQLQFTAGEGPCLAVHRIGHPTFSDDADMARRWPEFHDLLRRRTGYTAVASLPLRDRGRGFGALDLYLADDDGLGGLDTFTAVVTADLVAQHLTLGAMLRPAGSGQAGSPWFHGTAAPRLVTWQAIGMLMARHPLDADEALQVIRRRAVDLDTTTDAVGAAVVAGDVDAADL